MPMLHYRYTDQENYYYCMNMVERSKFHGFNAYLTVIKGIKVALSLLESRLHRKMNKKLFWDERKKYAIKEAAKYVDSNKTDSSKPVSLQLDLMGYT